MCKGTNHGHDDGDKLTLFLDPCVVLAFSPQGLLKEGGGVLEQVVFIVSGPYNRWAVLGDQWSVFIRPGKVKRVCCLLPGRQTRPWWSGGGGAVSRWVFDNSTTGSVTFKQRHWKLIWVGVSLLVLNKNTYLIRTLNDFMETIRQQAAGRRNDDCFQEI